MSTNLENYIKMNRDQFDTLSPSDALWAKIDVSLAKPVSVASKLSWLKYFAFGASVVAVVVYLKINSADAPTVISEIVKQESSVSMIASSEKANPIQLTAVSESKSVAPFTKGPAVFAQLQSSQEAPALEFDYLPSTQSIPYTDQSLLLENSNGAIDENNFGPSTQPSVTNSKKEENSFKADTSFLGIKTLEIISSSFEVDVKTNTGNQVFFKADITTETRGIVKGKKVYNARYERKDSTLTITIVCNSNMVVMGSCIVKNPILNFDVPQQTNLTIINSYGNVHASGLQGSNCKLQAKSGDISVEDINSDTKLVSSYGNVTASNIKGNLDVMVTSGDLSITNVTGNVIVKSTYGDQKYKGITGNLKTASTSGDIKIKNLKGDIEMASIYGSVSLEDCIGNLSIDAISGDISGKNVELLERMSTTSKYGSVDMQLVNDLNSLSFDLKTTYGEIYINKNGQQMSEEKALVINKGKILVTGVSTSGDQSYK